MKNGQLIRVFSGPKLPPNAAPVPLVAQETDFSCGPAALLAALRYFGVDEGATEHDLYGELGTTSKWGTSPEPMAAAAQARSLDADYEVGFSLEGLRRVLDLGGIAIVGIQAWSDDDEDIEWNSDTGDGHYVVAIGMDDENVYCMDPSLEDVYGYMPIEEFVSRWHDVESDGTFEHHPAIVIRGSAADAEIETSAVTRMG